MYHREGQGASLNSNTLSELYPNKRTRLLQKQRRRCHSSRRRRLSIEVLENRRLLASLFYWASGEKIELTEQSDQLAIKISNDSSNAVLEKLTAFDGLLADYRVQERVTDDVWRLEKASPIGPFITNSIDTESFEAEAVDWVTESFVASANGNQVVIVDELIVGLREGIAPVDFFESVRGLTGDMQYHPLLGTPDQFVVTLSGKSGQETLEIANVLAEDNRVRHSAPNTYQDVQKFFAPNDTLYPNQWHLNNTGTQVTDAIAGADINAERAWDISTGTGVTIAVIDDGMERTHPDLIDNIFINAGEIPGNNLDDDGNGYIDDVSGWSFTANSPNPTVTTGDAHATSVAGVAAGKGNNNLGVTGSAFNAKILPVQIFNGGSFVGDAGAASAIYYAAGRTANGLGTWNAAQILNNSWGGGSASTAITEAFTWASTNGRGGLGVASFISSGNGYSSTVSYPANLAATLSGVMAVGSTNHRNLRSEYSNYGTALDFVTPSNDIDSPYTVGITTTDRSGTLGYNIDDYTNNTVANGFGGTSSASPLAAGVGALLFAAEPTLTAAGLRAALRSSAVKVGGVTYDANGFNLEYGYGRLDAFAALSTLSMRPVSSVPAHKAVVSTPPSTVGGYQLNFNYPFDQTPANIDISKVSVNGITPIAYTIIDADTLQFDFATNPVTAQGTYSISVAAGATKRLSNGEVSAAYTSNFDFDLVPLAVSSITPSSNSVITLSGPVTIDVHFNEAITPSSIGVDDLALNVGMVTAATALDANTARYTINGVNIETTLNVNLAVGKLSDPNGLSNRAAFSASFFLDFATIAFPSTLVQQEPAGSMAYSASDSRLIGFTGDVDAYTLLLAPNQKLTVVVTPTSSTLQPRVEIFNAANVSQGFAFAPSAGRNAIIQSLSIPNGGAYRIEVRGQNGTTGSFSTRVLLNSAVELETEIVGDTNSSFGSAQNINSAFIDVDGSLGQVAIAAVSGRSDRSANGGFAITTSPSPFIEISTTGTRSIEAVGDDDFDIISNSQLAGFVFPFYGTTYDSVSFNTNGLITFDGATTAFSNGNLSLTPSLPTIAAFWDDLNVDDSGSGTESRAIFWEVVGSGANQQLIIQWNNVRLLGGTTYFTFQAILSRDGKIQINYAPTFDVSLLSSATVGVKAAGTSNPQRYVIHFNGTTSPWIAPNARIRLTPTPPLPDFYSFSLSAGESVSLAISNVPSNNLDLQLLGPNGTTVLATGTSGATNIGKMVSNFSAPTNGTYFARVTGAPPVPYNLVVAKNTLIEAENNQSHSTAQSMTGSPSILGAITSATDNDWYSIDVIAPGSPISVETRTPGDAGGSANNLLNPTIELYSPANVLLASGVALTDGRNESIQMNAPVSGKYRVRVTGGSATHGEYLLDARSDSLTSSLIVNRQVFYNRSTSSVFGNGTGNPINAIDPTKTALLPGETVSTIANFTNYSRGLNGIIVDISNPTNLSNIGASSFQFATWSDFTSTTPLFVAINPTVTVTTYASGGINGSDRVKLEFDNNVIQDAWLQIAILANSSTGLTANDIFYFGNARFDVTPTSSFPSQQVSINSFDTNAIRSKLGQNSETISNSYDVDRNGVVNNFDTNAVRANHGINSLRSFTATTNLPPNIAFSSLDSAFADSSWLEELSNDNVKNRQSKR
jgi:subtilisin family serine protease